MSSRIYTRTGDDGSTGLFGGRRVLKNDCRIEACGAIDELNAQLGVAIAMTADAQMGDILREIQNDLFSLGADLATPLEDQSSRGGITVERVDGARSARIEAWIDTLDEELPPLRAFILPGGTPLAANLHVCRAVCRRAERRVIALAQTDATNPEISRYLNRLSDYLFVQARTANYRAGIEDVLWSAGSGT